MVASACGSSSPSGVFARVDRSTLAPVESQAVLEFVGNGTSTTFTLGELESIEMVQVELYEPFVEANSTFQGPTAAAVFEKLGWDPAARVHILAINDYAFDMPVADLIEGDAMIATRENGAEIPIEAGGQARIVFPDWSPVHTLEDAWVWSLERFELLG